MIAHTLSRPIVSLLFCGLLAGHTAAAESPPAAGDRPIPIPSTQASVVPETDAARWMAAVGPAPELNIPASREAWEKQRLEIRAQLWKLLGDIPPRPAKLDVKTLSRQDKGDYWLEKFSFDNEAGAIVPGYLLLPKNPKAKSPAILYCHWHGGHYTIGKDELFGTNATPVPMGPLLARAGYVVIAIDAYAFGERNAHGPGGIHEKGNNVELSTAKFQLWVGRTMWGMILRDDLIALDYLASRPEVDAEKIGVTGISMGATRTWWLMGLDERLKAGSAICCLTRYQDLIAAESLKAHGIYYFVPGMLKHFDTEAVVALSAPRPLLFQSGGLDAGSPVAGIKKIEAKAQQAYALYGDNAPANFNSIIYPELGHVYSEEMVKQTMAWFEKALK